MHTPGEQPEGNGSAAHGSSGGAPSGPEGAGTAGDVVGRVLAGRYRVTGRLGRGGMGVVWRATDERLGREVAVKELRTWTDAASSELGDLRTRMEREARAAARVRHSGVIAVHDVAQHEGRPVIVMELVEGPSLDDVLRERGSLEPREAAAIGAKVMKALDAAHRAGVLHRDVKPGNVLLEGDGERVVLTDFGIATMEDPDDGAGTRLTGSGELVGSLDYLAPERARGEQPREASDVWALGAMLYAAVEGAAPFRRTSTWSTLNAIVVEPLPEPRRAGPLAPVLAELMAKDPGQRPDAARATALLNAVAEGTDVPSASQTVRLRTAGAPSAGQARPPGGQGVFPARQPGGPQPPYGSAQPPGAADGPQPERDTVRTGPGRSRRRALVAAAAAAVVLAGSGVTYVLVGAGEDDGARAAGRQQERAGASGGTGARSEGSSKGDGRTDGGGDRSDSRPEGGGSAGDAEGGSRPGDGGGEDRKPGGSGGGSTTGGLPGDGGGDAGSGGSGGGAAVSGGGGQGPGPACAPRGGGKFDCSVWKKATSFNSAHEPVGELNAGTNYFFCQKKLGHRETSGRWTNVWWAKTDDDSGNRKVWVSVVYIRGGGNDEPVPGLPTC